MSALTNERVPNLLNKTLDKAEKKARKRDRINSIDEKINEISKNATEVVENKKGARVIIAYDEPHNKTEFTQMLVKNLSYLNAVRYIEKDKKRTCFLSKSKEEEKALKNKLKVYRYLSDAEELLMYRLAFFLEPYSNQLYDLENDMFLTVRRISEILDRNRENTSDLINSLIKKGILLQGNTSDKSIVDKNGNIKISESRQLYVNPELFYTGNKNKVNATLCSMLRSNNHSAYKKNIDILEKQGIKLPFKIIFDSGNMYGKIVTRKTYEKHDKKEPVR